MVQSHAPRWVLSLSAALLVLLALSLASMSIGAYRKVSLYTVLEYVLHSKRVPPIYAAIIHVRLLRTLAGVIVGAALAFSGASLQYVFRNPLADPYIFGIASGAALGVILSLYWGQASPMALYTAASLGAIAALALVAAGGVLGGGTAFSYIVAGVGIGYLLWAMSMILVLEMGPRAHYSAIWLFGTLAYIDSAELRISLIVVIAVLAVALSLHRRYSRLLLGEEVSAIYGTPYRRALLELTVLSGVATAAATAMAGPVGFVGLVAPWIARLTGTTLYAGFIASTVVWGSSLVLFSDVTARLLGGPVELPLTAIMSFVGVPFIIYIMVKLRGSSAWR